MRNPLNCILNHHQILQDTLAKLRKTPNLPPEIIELLDRLDLSALIQGSSSKMLKFFVNDILDFAQIKNQSFFKESKSFDIREAVQEVIMT